MSKFARMIITDHKKFLVIKNAAKNRNRWEFPGGKLDENEAHEAAAKREAYEEVGVNVKATFPVAPLTLTLDDVEWFGIFFYATDWDGVPSLYEPEKFSEMRWVTIEELSKLPQIPAGCVDMARLVEKYLWQ